MTNGKSLLMGLALLATTTPLFAQAQAGKKVDFKNETYGSESKSFGAISGNWHIDKDGNILVYAADGRNKGTEFPMSIFKGVNNFTSGVIEVSFRAISGKEDQAAGIAFDIKANGDYLVVRANALENNLVLFKMQQGNRSSLQWAENAPTLSGQWHTLKVEIKGNRVEGYLDDKKYIDYTQTSPISGKVGLWSKADSYVFFKKFELKQ